MKITGWSSDSIYIDGERKEVRGKGADMLKRLIELDEMQFTDSEYNLFELSHSVPVFQPKKECGYEYGCKLENWAKKHEDVQSFRFDDHLHTSSVGVAFPVKSKYQHMGVEVHVVPQHGTPTEIFLYPHDLDAMIAALTKARHLMLSVPREDESSPRKIEMRAIKQALLDLYDKSQTNASVG